MEIKFITKYGPKNEYPQSYDKDKIEIKKGGKTYNVYQAIQAANEDCDIYKTLEKYGIVEPTFADVETYFQNKNNAQAFYKDFSEFEANMHPADYQAKAEEKWNNLPLAIRNAFNNSLEEFSKNGIENIQKIINDTLKKEAEKNTTSNNTENKGVNNEQK